ncbi:MAG: RT0821/Lpp0805 family surface protein [Gammaproteobacteria bacterium]|nr:RT0821/Lpp0805 family surface protein [Gammaproteobacteria bacterium]
MIIVEQILEHDELKKLIIVILTASILALSGCQGMRKEDTGALAGAAVGGAVGHNFGSGRGKALATFAGAVLGAFAGSNVGRRLDMYDEQQAQRALEYNETGSQTSWVNPDSGKQVTFVPTETYQRSSGQYCREYQTQVEVGGRVEEAYGTACRQPDGSWQIQ